jgi:hypothetical protein
MVFDLYIWACVNRLWISYHFLGFKLNQKFKQIHDTKIQYKHKILIKFKVT